MLYGALRGTAAALALAASVASPNAAASDSAWTGADAASFSTPANWSNGVPCGAGGIARFITAATGPNVTVDIPCSLDQLRFSSAVASWAINGPQTLSMNAGGAIQNDSSVTFAALAGQDLLISGSGSTTIATGAMNFSGPVTVASGGLTASPASGVNDLTIAAGATVITGEIIGIGFTQWGALSGAGTLSITQYGMFTGGVFSGNVQGSVLVERGPGTLTLTGGANSFGQLITHPGGTLTFGDGVSGSVPSNFFFIYNQGDVRFDLGPAGVAQVYDIQYDGNVFVDSGQLYQGAATWTYGGNTTIGASGHIGNKTVNLGGTVTVNGDWAVNNGTVGGLAGTGNNVFIIAGTLNVGTNNADTVFSGNITDGGSSTLRKVGTGKLTIERTIVPTVDVAQGELHLVGQQVGGTVFVRSGAKLSGGAAGFNGVVVEPGATFAPTSYVTNGTLNSSGTLSFAIDSAVQNDIVVLGQAPDITGSTLVLTGSYVPVLGDSFTVVRNDSANPSTGAFTGRPEGSLVTFNGIGLRISYVGGSGNNDVVLSVAPQVVTPSVGAPGSGTILADTPQTVANGTTTSFTLTPAAHYHIAPVTGTCGGSLVGNMFTTSAVTTDCTVVANFAIDTNTVTSSAAANGSISLSQSVSYGSTASFTLTPNSNYHSASVGGTCPAGTLTGDSYQTGVIVAPCTVIANFAIDTHTVTPSAGVNGSILPNTPQRIDHNAQAAFTVTPNPGYAVTVGGTCGGLLVGNIYTTGAITHDCAVSATFVPLVTYNVVLEGWQQSPYVVTAASGGGTAIYNPVAHTLKLNLTYSGLSSAEGVAHLHGPGARGANAAVLVSLAAGSPKTDEITLLPTEETMLANGQLYVNIHTTSHPAGEIRGQVDNVGATVTHALTVTRSGSGTVAGTTEAGTVITCGVDCSETVPDGKVVTLTATPDAGSALQGWGGACSGVTTCTVTMDAAKTVSATFVSLGSDLGTAITATPNPAIAGQDVTFTLTVSSAGPEAGDGVNTWAFIPSGATFVSASAGCTQSTLGPNPIVLCTPNTLAIGATAQYTFALRRAVAGTLTVNADVSSTKQDPVAANNQSTVSVTVNPQTRLGNISTRMRVGTGNDVMIGGFVIGGASNKRVAIVATGPSLTQYGIANALAHPTLTLVRQSDQTVIASNDGWQNAGNAAQLTAAGFAPSNPIESAILANLAPGAYTAIVQGAGGGTGVAVVGVYEVDGGTVPLVNISTRGRVLTGNDVMIGGFVIDSVQPKTLAIVATGPSLAAYGIAQPLANPTITLVRSSDQTVVASNDDWQQDANAAQLLAAGFAPTNPLESALLVTLPAGAYTVIVSGVGGTTGVAVIGVYAVD